VGVGAGVVDVEDVGEGHLSGAEVDTAFRHAVGEGELGSLRVDEPGGEAEGLVEFSAGDVGRGAESGIADDVEVGEARETESFGDSATAGGLEIEEDVGVEARVRVELVAGVV